MIGNTVNTMNNSATFKLKSANEGQRYTAILAQTHQTETLVGLYVIIVTSTNQTIIKIAGTVDATIARSGDNVTVTFGIDSIWTNGILLAPKEFV